MHTTNSHSQPPMTCASLLTLKYTCSLRDPQFTLAAQTMPVLRPSSSPPQSNPSLYPQRTGNAEIEIAHSVPNLIQSDQITSQTNQNSNPESSSNPTRKIPSITIDADVITDVMAARLATSLLGHILFLKSQVPL